MTCAYLLYWVNVWSNFPVFIRSTLSNFSHCIHTHIRANNVSVIILYLEIVDLPLRIHNILFSNLLYFVLYTSIIFSI
jgi:hypothetical protein